MLMPITFAEGRNIEDFFVDFTNLGDKYNLRLVHKLTFNTDPPSWINVYTIGEQSEELGDGTIIFKYNTMPETLSDGKLRDAIITTTSFRTPELYKAFQADLEKLLGKYITPK